MKVKTFIAVALVALFAVAAVADGPVVTSASFLEWDYASNSGITGFRVYLSTTPGIVPDGTSFVAELPETARQWAISSPGGQQNSMQLSRRTSTTGRQYTSPGRRTRWNSLFSSRHRM